jgi:hypothetical protein
LQPGQQLPSNIKQLFQSSFLEYRAIKEDFKYQYDGCLACSSLQDYGDLHISADGNFRLFRRKLAGKYNYRCNKENNLFIDIKPTLERSNLDVAVTGCSSEFRCPTLKKHVKNDQTGVFALFCARHEVPFRWCDMFTGERFIYISTLLKTMTSEKDSIIYLYYDIACKLKNHLELNQFDMDKIFLCVPKLHAHVHEWKCFRKYHPIRIIGSGDTDGETSERAWSYLGRFSLISREMLSANRRDLLNDAFHYYKKKKQIRMLKSINIRLINKKKELVKKRLAFELLGKTFDEAKELYRKELDGKINEILFFLHRFQS